MEFLVRAVCISTQTAPLVTLSDRTITWLGIAALLLLILLSAFFASAEIAIFSLENHRLSALIEAGRPGARTLSALKADPRRLLVTILVGNNIANIGMSSIATGLLGMYLTPGESVLIATFGITSIVLLFGETAPKSYGVEHNEGWSLRVARPLRLVQFLLAPLVTVFDVLTKVVNRLLGSAGDFETAYLTRAEVSEVITAGRRSGVFSEEEHRMLQRLLRFRNRTCKETMVPRLDVIGVEQEEDLDTAIAICLREGVIELPVYDDVLDTVVATVTVLELVAAKRDKPARSLPAVGADPIIVPESKEVDDLLMELRAERRRMAIVVDEFGTTAGIVTIEDIIEEIIGEVLSETEAAPIRWVDDTTAIVRGELNVHTANELLGVALPENGEFESLAGLLMANAGSVVAEGETVTVADVVLTVETTENNRVLEVRVDLPESPPATDPALGID